MSKLKVAKKTVDKLMGKTPSDIQDFPEEKLVELDLLIFEEKGAYQIATILQKEWGYFKGKVGKTVARHVQKYMESELCRSRQQALKDAEEQIIETRFDRKINALNEMEELFTLQKERLQAAVAKEKDLPGGILLKQVSEAAKDLTATAKALAHLQLATGVIAKAPTKVSGVVTDDTGKEQKFSWTMEAEALFRQVTDDHQDQ